MTKKLEYLDVEVDYQVPHVGAVGDLCRLLDSSETIAHV